MLRHLRFLLACSSVILATQTPVAAEIVAFWRFEDGAFLADSSGNGHTLTASGDVAQSADVCDGSGAAPAAAGSSSAFFDGDGDSFQTPLNLSDYTQLRVSWWQKCAALSGDQMIFEHSANFTGTAGAIASFRGMRNYNDGNGSVLTQFGATRCPASSTYNIDKFPGLYGEWEHIVIEFDRDAALAADVVQVWRNGTKVGAEVFNSLAGGTFGNDTFYIGTRGNTTNWLDGMIDELKIESIPEPGCLSVLWGVSLLGMLYRPRRRAA